jgi:uncharacterized protein involved in copper resistance
MDLLLRARGKKQLPIWTAISDQACLEAAGQGAHEKGSRVYYLFTRDVVPYFGEHELGYTESGRGLLEPE